MMTLPTNAVTGKPYKGSNVGTLIEAMEAGGFSDPRFLTFRQALKLGRVVQKGQKAAARVVKFKKATPEEEERTGRRFIPCGGWNVFNIEQTVELPVKVEEAA
jgi:antirestriction protein ArdC